MDGGESWHHMPLPDSMTVASPEVSGCMTEIGGWKIEDCGRLAGAAVLGIGGAIQAKE